MKFWTILALLIAVFAVFFEVGHTEELDDFGEKAFEVVGSDKEHENVLEFEDVRRTPLNDEDEPAMFKRAPWRRRRARRFRRRLRRIRRKIRTRRLVKTICEVVVNKEGLAQKVCKIINQYGDEEAPRVRNDEKVIVPVDKSLQGDGESWEHEV